MSRTICGICWCTYDDDTGKCDCPHPAIRDDTALLRQALEALIAMRPACFAETTTTKADAAIAALRERLGETK